MCLFHSFYDLLNYFTAAVFPLLLRPLLAVLIGDRHHLAASVGNKGACQNPSELGGKN
jgi:hypothetical protein